MPQVAAPAAAPASGPALPGAPIGRIRVDRRQIFDSSLPGEDVLLFRWANWLHVLTREQTVLEQLLFKPGDAYDPRLLEESERLLRSSRYLRVSTSPR